MSEHNASLPRENTSRFSVVPLVPAILVVLIVVVIGAFAYLTQYGTRNSRNWVVHTYTVRDKLQTLDKQLAEVRGTALAYAVSGDPNHRKLFEESGQKIQSAIEELRQLTADNPRQQFRLGELESLYRQYLTQLEKVATSQGARSASSPEEVSAIREIDSQELRLDALTRGMADDEKLLLDGRLATFNHWFYRNALVLAFTFAVAVFLLVYNFRLLTREVARTQEMERVQLEHARSLRSLSARILDLQDAERRRVARELHDSVGQYLVGLKINLEQLQHDATNLAAGHARLLAETVDMTDRCISEVRTISHLLHPPLLDEVGFESAAAWYADGFAKRCGLKVNLQLAKFDDRLPKETELALFRILQEALTNVHRHADAKSIQVSLTCDVGRVILTVHDDGRGVSREVLTRFRSGFSSGVGLAGMRERLAELNGTLEVEALPRGTLIRATIPTLERAASEGRTVVTIAL
jgi:signal transduction histidine kinase